jgi:hypothetical protein
VVWNVGSWWDVQNFLGLQNIVDHSGAEDCCEAVAGESNRRHQASLRCSLAICEPLPFQSSGDVHVDLSTSCFANLI